MHPHTALLAACTPLEITAYVRAGVAAAAEAITDWARFVTAAEEQRMAPLAYRALKGFPDLVPESAMQQLRALSLRHRLINAVRITALEEGLEAADKAGIRPLVLKGAALCSLVYPEPGLRPMSDIDLLVDDSQLLALQAVFLGQGFSAAPMSEMYREHRHLPPLYREVEGFHISLELHHSLYSHARGKHHGQLDDLISPMLEFYPAGGSKNRWLTLGAEDMLAHTCSHFTLSEGQVEPFRMVWLADLQAFLARFGSQLDWELLRERAAFVLNTLSYAQLLCPLPDDVMAYVPPSCGRQPSGVGDFYQGWPTLALTPTAPPTRSSGYRNSTASLLRQSVAPSQWWLGLCYGEGGPGWEWRLYPRHWLQLLWLAGQRLRARLRAKLMARQR
jgi:hypothetical protein